eukprot:6209972-Pleurochrysis_carterae.AAC.1
MHRLAPGRARLTRKHEPQEPRWQQPHHQRQRLVRALRLQLQRVQLPARRAGLGASFSHDQLKRVVCTMSSTSSSQLNLACTFSVIGNLTTFPTR